MSVPDDVLAPPAAFPLPAWAAIGVAAAATAALPWAVTGMLLPLHSAWNGSDAQPFVLLPFSPYSLTLLAGVLLMGGVFAGGAARLLRRYRTRSAVAVVLATVAAAQLVAVVQSTFALAPAPGGAEIAREYLAALAAGALLTIAGAALIGWVLASAPPAGAMIGSALAGVAASSWAAGFLGVLGPTVSPPWWLLSIPRWIPAIVVGFAIVRWGVASAGRIAAAIASLLVLWAVPPVVLGVAGAVSSRVFAGSPDAMIAFAVSATEAALFVPDLVLPPITLALAIAIVGLAVREIRRHRPRAI